MGRRNISDPRGRDAEDPADIPTLGLKDVSRRIFETVFAKRVSLVSAGIAYYLLLSLFPAMAAVVSLYGLIADPLTLEDTISVADSFVPSAALDILRQQLRDLATQESQGLNFGFVIGLMVALWSANNGIKALFEGMNVAYGEAEKRSFIKLNLVALAFTVGAGARRT